MQGKALVGDHNCIHDRLARASPVVRSLQQYEVGVPHSRRLHDADAATPADDHGRTKRPSTVGATPPELRPGPDAAPSPAPTRQPIRIHMDTRLLDSDPQNSCFRSGDYHYTEFNERKICYYEDVITDNKRDQLRDVILPGAVNFMSELLSVHRVAGPLRVGAATCGFDTGVRVPDEMRRRGIPDADFVVFVTMRPIKSPDTVAYSGHCEVDQTGRPIAAHFNWAPSQLPYADSQHMIDYLIRIAMHELTHSLVFSQELIASFPGGGAPTRQPDGGGGLGWAYDSGYYGDGTSYFDTGRGVKAHVSTPKVVQAARNHFGCDKLRGAQLEDGGGAGTSNSHWEMRNFRDEYMVGSSSPSKRYFSTITAALFADSGWYDVNANMVEHLAWGHGLGCDFVFGSCSKWKDLRDGYFCERNGETSCSYDRTTEAYCEVMTYPSLPTEYQHLSASDRGGFSPLLDYCPVYRTYSNGGCTEPSAYNRWLPGGGQERCATCRCFESSIDGYVIDQPGCFKMRCLNSSSLQVKAGGRWHTCPSEGGRLYLDTRKDAAGGSLVCPSASEMCMLDATLWPTLSSIEPSSGPAAGGVVVTLVGANLDAFHQPVTLTIGTAEGFDSTAGNLVIINSTLATATMPLLVGATSFARADITLVDHRGRAAYLFESFRYVPGWRPYAATLGVFFTMCVLALAVVPALVRSFCTGSHHRGAAVAGEKPVWRPINKEALRMLLSRASGQAATNEML